MKCIVGCHQSQIIESPPPIGSLLTIKHSGYFKNGILKHPFYWRSTGTIQSLEGYKLNWKDITHHRELFDSIGNRLNYKILDDFYKILSDCEVKLLGIVPTGLYCQQ